MELKMAAAEALAGSVGKELTPDYVIPNSLESRVFLFLKLLIGRFLLWLLKLLLRQVFIRN